MTSTELLEKGIKVLENIKWKSIDKDNMEFSATITCYQMDKLRDFLTIAKERD